MDDAVELERAVGRYLWTTGLLEPSSVSQCSSNKSQENPHQIKPRQPCQRVFVDVRNSGKQSGQPS